MKYVISATAILLANVGVFALPQGGRIESGTGNLDNPAHIIQESQHLQTRWNSFDIGTTEQVRIEQPNAQASINIKVSNGGATNINGTLTANGRVSLENPAGIQFGENSVVNVGGLLASSANGSVTSLGQVSAAEAVRFQGLSGESVVNVGGNVSAQEIIVEGNGDIVIGNSAHFTASQQVLIGGGYQGKDSNVLNARTNDVKAAAQINAPYVIVWSDKETRFLGRIDAGRGFVEVSGKQSLIFPDISRVTTGTLLLDPENITIVAGTGADDSILASNLVVASDSPGATFTLGATTITNYGFHLFLRATGTVTVNADITRSSHRLLLEGNNIVINAAITINGGNFLALNLTGVAPSAPFVFGSGGSITTGDLRLFVGYTDSNYQFTPDASLTAHLEAPVRRLGITAPANVGVALAHGLNLCNSGGTCGGLTINAGAITLTGDFFSSTANLTVAVGAIVFNSGTTITSSSAALRQVDAFPVTAPATTFSTPPTLSARVGFLKLPWGGCGTNCFDPATDIVVTDGDLTAALVGKATINARGDLDLASLSLWSTGVPLVVPAGIKRILTGGAVSITGGLTAEAALKIFSDRIELGGIFMSSMGDITFGPQNDDTTIGAVRDLTFSSHVVLTRDVNSLGSLDFNLTLDSAATIRTSTFVILGKNITLNGAFTVTASTTITAANDLAVNDTITAGAALALEATAGGITFTGTPTITATTSITLTQADEFSRTAPADFGSVVPAIVRTGTPQRSVSWATGGVATIAGDIIVDAGSADITLTDAIMGYFEVDGGGILPLGAFTLSLTTTGTIIFPANLSNIIGTGASALSLSAGGISGGAATFTTSTGMLALKGTFDFGAAAVTLNGGNQLDFSKGAVSITAGSLSITGAVSASGSLAGSDPLTFTATGNLTLARHIGSSATPINLSYGGPLSGTPTLATSALSITHTGADATTLPSWVFGAYPTTLTTPSSIDIAAATTWTGSSITFTTDTNIRGNGALTLNVPTVDAGTNNLTITLPSLTLGNSTTMTAANITLTATAGAIDFGSSSTITAPTINLSQTAAYATSLPATFSTTPTLTSPVDFTKPSWGACGANCLAPANLTITDGDLNGAVSGTFALSGTTLDLGTFNLTASGMALDIPSTITSIITTGTISITGGLTATAALNLNAGAMVLGGTLTAGANALTLTSVNAITAGSALVISSALVVAAPSLGSAGSALTLTGNVSSSGSTALELRGSNITLGVGTFTTGALTLTSANAITTSSDLTISSALVVAAPSLGTAGFSLTLADLTGSAALTLLGANITLGGAVDVGSNALTITAAAGAIAFNNTPTITARSIALTQVDVFSRDAPAATFSIKPAIVRSGGTEQRAVPWATGGMTIAGDVELIGVAHDINLEEAIIGYFEIDSNGLLDLGDFDLALLTSGKVTFPARLKEIRTTDALQFGAGSIEGVGSQLALVASTIFLSGPLDFGATALSLRATTTLDLLGTAAATISADSIEFDVAAIANGAALSLTARTGSLTLSGDINLGTVLTNILTLNFATSIGEGATAPTLTSGEIIVRHTGSGAITLPEWLFTGQNVNLSVAAITLSADTTWNVRRLGFERDTTITGTTHALTLAIPPSENFISAIGLVLTIDVGSLSFSSKVVLAAGNLNITTRTAGADNGFNLTLTGADGLTVAGHINAGTGALILGADRAKIIFTNNPTITGATITLSQNATYDRDEPANFSITPVASRVGLADGEAYTIHTWATCPSGDSNCGSPQNIALVDQTSDIILTDVISGKFALTESGTLTLAGSDLELRTTANIIIPATLTAITTSGNITLVGASIITLGGTAIGNHLRVNANVLTLGGAINAGTNNLTFTTSGGALLFATDTTINGAAITLLGGDIAISSPANVALVIASSAALALAGVVNVGTGSITLTTSTGFIDFSSATGIIGHLTAATITLTQVDAYRVTRPGTFSVLPAVNRSGSDNFIPPSWGVCGVDAECFTPVDIAHTAAGDATLLDIIAGTFFVDGAGVLDLSSSNFSINISGALTLPAGLTQITTAGGNITLIANTFTNLGALTIQTTTSGDITLQGTYNVGTTLGFTLTAAGALNFGTGAETSITAGLLTLSSGAAATASTQKLTLFGNTVIVFNNTDINVAELVLRSDGGFTGTPTITTDDLTYNFTGGSFITPVFAGSHWVFAAGRNVTLITTNNNAAITLFAANRDDTINLCAADGTTCGNLTLESATEIRLADSTQTSASLGTISANNITLTAGTRIGSDSTDINRNLTIKAAGDLTIDTPSLALRNTQGAALTFDVAGSTTFTQDITLDAETMSGLGGTITAAALTLSSADSTTGSIVFSTARATNITTTGAITLEFESAGTASGQNLTLAASGGDITLGALNIGSGILEVTTDQNIAFTATPDITAAEVFLTWAGNTDFGATAPATFTGGILPFVEAANQTAAAWFQLAGFSFDAGSAAINFFEVVTLKRGSETIEASVDENGVLDFDDNIIRLTTLGNIILPGRLVEIRARNLTITAATIGRGTRALPFSRALAITTTENLELNGNLAMNTGIALNLSFSGRLGGAPTLTTTDLGITSTGSDSDAITLPDWVFGDDTRQLRLNVAAITLAANEKWEVEKITLGKDTTITSTSTFFLSTPTVEAGANTLTINVDQLNFLTGAASTITAEAVSLTTASASEVGSDQALTITATNNLTLAGRFTIGAGAMILTATQGVIVFTNTTLTATSFSLTQGGAAFAAAKPATFRNNAGDAPPTIRYTGGLQPPVDWDVEPAEAITETEGGGYNINTLLSEGEAFAAFETTPGILDFGDTDLILETDNNITIPARITEIRARNIIIRAGIFGRGTVATPAALNRDIEFVATDGITFRADIQSGNKITFTGAGITFNDKKTTRISASEIVIATTGAGFANNQNVFLEATGNITLAGDVDVGLGSLIINAGGSIVTTDTTSLRANKISYNPAVVVRNANPLTLTAYDDIYLPGVNLNNGDGALSLTAGGSIVTGSTRSILGTTVSFKQGQARYETGRLLLRAFTGALTIEGHIAHDMITLRVSDPALLDLTDAILEGVVIGNTQ